MRPLQFRTFVLAAGLVLMPAWLEGAFAQESPQLEDGRREALTSQKRDETIEQLRRIIPKIDDRSTQKADLLYQLSELYVEKSKELRRGEMSEYDQRYKDYEQAKKRGEKRPEPQANHRGSESYRAEAIALYEKILREYPGYERKDEVLFALGYNLYEIGKRADAIARYLQLIRAAPNSSFVPDTYLQLGNHYFDVGNDLARARQFYTKALGSNLPKVHSYALYKLAWCDYNAGDFEGALRKLQQVVDFAQSHGREMVDLKNEALSDLPSVYVRLGQSDEAIDYFRRAAPPKQQRKLVVRLATQLAEAGQYDKAIRAYRYLIAGAPAEADAPELQQAIVRCYEGLRDRAQVKLEIRRLVGLYRSGGEWWRVNENRKDVLRAAFNVSEEAMRTLAVDYHQEAQRTKQVETYRLARDIYAEYVAAFGSSSDESFVSDQALNMRFYYAEIFWALEDWENAANQYEAVVGFKIPNRESAREVSDEKFRKSAAYNVVLAYDKLVKIDRGDLARSDLKPGQVLSAPEKSGLERTRIEKKSAQGAAERLTDYEEKLVAACDRYNQFYPGDQVEVELRYLAAVIYYQRRQFPEAAQRFEQLADRWPEDHRSQQAADLAMHILEMREEWMQLNRLSRHFLGNPRLSKPGTDFAKRAAKIVEGSQYKWVDEVVYRKEKNPAKAAQEFIRFGDEFPRSEYTPRALTYAVISFGEAHQLDDGISAGERMLNSHRASPFELKVRFTLARYYEKIAAFSKAASMYESFVAAYDRRAAEAERVKGLHTGSKRRGETKGAETSNWADAPDESLQLLKEAEKSVADAQFNAAVWWEALERFDRAGAAYRAYISRFKDAKDAPEVRFNLGSLYEKSGRLSEAIKTYREFESEYANDKRVSPAQRYLARYRQLVALHNQGNARESERLLDELIRQYGRLSRELKKRDDVQEAHASVRFWKVEPIWKEYAQRKFARVETIRRDLDAKRRKLKQLETAYTEVLAVGSADYGIAALTRIGLAYADLAQNIVESPDPRGLTGEQRQLYRGELQKIAAPIEIKAVEAFEKAVAKGSELGVYNEWILIAQDNINKIQPGAFATAREVPYRPSDAVAAAAPLQKDGGRRAPTDQVSSRAPSVSASESR